MKNVRSGLQLHPAPTLIARAAPPPPSRSGATLKRAAVTPLTTRRRRRRGAATAVERDPLGMLAEALGVVLIPIYVVLVPVVVLLLVAVRDVAIGVCQVRRVPRVLWTSFRAGCTQAPSRILDALCGYRPPRAQWAARYSTTLQPGRHLQGKPATPSVM